MSDSQAHSVSRKLATASTEVLPETDYKYSVKFRSFETEVPSPSTSLSHESHRRMEASELDDEWKPTELDDIPGLDMQDDQERQAQEVYGKLRELGHTSEKVEEALRLVLGSPA